MYPDIPDNLQEDVRHQPEGEAQALKQEKVQGEGANIVEGEEELHNYATKYATALGIVQIVCAVISMLAVGVLGVSAPHPLPAAGMFLPSVFFFVSGSVTIQGAVQKSRCLVSAGQALSILSAIVAALFSISLASVFSYASEGRLNVSTGNSIAMIAASWLMVTMRIVATISALLPCLIQGNASKVQENAGSPASGSALMKRHAIIAMSVVHLICGLLLLLADMISTRHVGVASRYGYNRRSSPPVASL